MLTPLQKLAAERIEFFQKALKEKGLHVRLAFEQEFAVSHNNQPAIDPILADKPVDELENVREGKYNGYSKVSDILKKDLPTFTMLEREAASHADQLQIYEAKFDNGSPLHNSQHTALDTAMDATRFREDTVKKLLTNTTCLNSEWAGKALTANFSPLPFPESRTAATLGLHANLSVYNDKRENLFVAEGKHPSIFLDEVSRRLQELQREGGLAYLPTPEGLSRFGTNESSPNQIGISAAKNEGKTLVRHHHVTIFRKQGFKQLANFYLEDRMPASNAEPLVVAAMQLAAVYDVVQNGLPENHKHTSELKSPFCQLNRDSKPWVERFQRDAGLSRLLGKPLYEAILKEYSQNHQREI